MPFQTTQKHAHITPATIYEAIPPEGIDVAGLAKKLNTTSSAIYNRLASMETAGYLLWQDDRNRLHKSEVKSWAR